MIKRYWFKFKESSEVMLPIGISHGCGVSAESYADAVKILQSRVFLETAIPSIEIIKEDIDISSLDENHVLPNMGDVMVRGVWFPLGYE